MLIVTFPFLFVSVFMFACFGYEYGMGKILANMKFLQKSIINYIKDNEIAKFMIVASIILVGVIILIGVR